MAEEEVFVVVLFLSGIDAFLFSYTNFYSYEIFIKYYILYGKKKGTCCKQTFI